MTREVIPTAQGTVLSCNCFAESTLVTAADRKPFSLCVKVKEWLEKLHQKMSALDALCEGANIITITQCMLLSIKPSLG